MIIFAISEYDLQQILLSGKGHFISEEWGVYYCWEDYDKQRLFSFEIT